MRPFFLAFCLLFFRGVLMGQALMDFVNPMLDNTASFFSETYDRALLRKNKVESCLLKNRSFYFDSNGGVTTRRVG
jgi:hypothetical protein